MYRPSSASNFVGIFAIAITLLFQSARAQDFEDGTLSAGGEASSVSLIVDSFSGNDFVVLKNATPIESGPDSVINRDIFVTDNPINLPNPFTLESSGALTINPGAFNVLPPYYGTGGTISLFGAPVFNSSTAVSALPIFLPGQPFSNLQVSSSIQIASEPSIWLCLLSGMSLLAALMRYRSAKI